MFNKLFIIGNGFDKAHGFSTSYSDFKSWMETQLNCVQSRLSKKIDIQNTTPELPNYDISNHGEEVVDYDEALVFLMWLLINNSVLDQDWNNFEESLYELDLEEALLENSYFVDDASLDKDGVINPFWQANQYEDMASQIKVAVNHISKLFTEWISSVDISEREIYSSVESEKDNALFLTFNYTETLEKLYKIPSKCINHIHGIRFEAVDYCDERILSDKLGNLIIGHGNDQERLFNDEFIESYSILQETIKSLRKNTYELIEENNSFWELIFNNRIERIYSFGFSYSDVDLPYIRKIIQSLGDSKVLWLLNSFNDTEAGGFQNQKYQQIIRECGFVGDFGRF